MEAAGRPVALSNENSSLSLIRSPSVGVGGRKAHSGVAFARRSQRIRAFRYARRPAAAFVRAVNISAKHRRSTRLLCFRHEEILFEISNKFNGLHDCTLQIADCTGTAPIKAQIRHCAYAISRDPYAREGVKSIVKLECGPMPNVMVALSNIGGALCSTPQSLADAHY